MANRVVEDHPGDIILYFGPRGSPWRTTAQIHRDWLRDNFPYCDRTLQDDQVTFLSFPNYSAQQFKQICKYMDSQSFPPLFALIDPEQCLHYCAQGWPDLLHHSQQHGQYLDPIALYALAEKLEHNGVMMKVIDLLNEFSQTHDALPHELLLEQAYKTTKTGSHLRRFLLQIWIEEFHRRNIGGDAYRHLSACLDDSTHAFDICYLQGVYKGLKVKVWDAAQGRKIMKPCHCVTCNNKRCPKCKRGVCNEVQELDRDEKWFTDLLKASQDRLQTRDTWWGEYKPTPNNWERPHKA